MDYTFSWGWFFVGLIVLVAAVLFIRFHQVIADNMGGGVGSYERYRLYGLIACAVALIVMLNIHSTVLTWFFGLFFNRS